MEKSIFQLHAFPFDLPTMQEKSNMKFLLQHFQLVDLTDSAFDIEADRRRRRKNVNEIIDDFLEAKKFLNTIFRPAKMMNRKKIPVIKEILDGYFDFFLKAEGVCSKVTGYAEKIYSETEKTLGTKSIWAEAENNAMSYLNLRRKALLNLKREIY